MPGSEGYILSFDFNEISRNIEDLKKQYIDLSNTFKTLSEDSEKTLDNLVSKISLLSGSLDVSFQKLNAFYSKPLGNVEYISKYFGSIAKDSKSITKSLTTLGSVDISKAFSKGEERGKVSGGLSTPTAAVGGADFSLQMSLVAREGEKAEEAIQRAERSLSAARKAIEESQRASGKLLGIIKKEAGSAKGEMTGLLGSVPGAAAFGGGFLAGLIGLMVLGEQQKQRISAQAAEMKTAVATAGGIFNEGVQKASDQLARFAENAQYRLGIGRKEIQGIVNQVANAGIKITERLVPVTDELEKVRSNVFTMTIALDKMFKLSSGTSMQRALELVREYGMSINSATQNMVKLSFAAQSSGMDIQRFIGTVMSGTSVMAQYGFEVGDVANMLQIIKKRYDDLGVDPTRGGELAAQSMEAISRGLTNLPKGIEYAIAKRLFPEMTAPEGRIKMKEVLLTGSKEEKAIMNAQYVKAVYDIFKELSPTKAVLIEHLEQNLGLDFKQAEDFISMAEKFKGGKGLKELTPAQEKLYRETFEREGSQLTELQKLQRDLIDTMAKIGQGLLLSTTALIASIITGFRSLSTAIGSAATILNPASSNEETRAAKESLAKIQDQFVKIYGTMEKGSNLVIEGISDLPNILGERFKGMIQPMKDALDFDFRSELQKEIDKRAEKIQGRLDTAIDYLDSKITKALAGIVLQGSAPIFGNTVAEMAAAKAMSDESRAREAAEADRRSRKSAAEYANKYLRDSNENNQANNPYLNNVFQGTVQTSIPSEQLKQVVHEILSAP